MIPVDHHTYAQTKMISDLSMLLHHALHWAVYETSQFMRLWYLSHMQPAKAQGASNCFSREVRNSFYSRKQMATYDFHGEVRTPCPLCLRPYQSFKEFEFTWQENSLDNVFLVINLFYNLQSGSNGFITEGRRGGDGGVQRNQYNL